MNYKQSMDYISEISKSGSILGLDNIKAIVNELGSPQNDLKIIHIAGTNGKGSTLAFISNILIACGYKVGRYISPTIKKYEERFQINEEIISENKLAEILTEVKEADLKLRKKSIFVTAFEAETAAAFLLFKKENCDFVILETGLGGSMDATNIIEKNLISVFTSISIDHTMFLGNTLAEIAEKKAGIIKKNSSVVSSCQKDEVGNILRKKAEEIGAKNYTEVNNFNITDINFNGEYQVFSYKNFHNIQTSLLGVFQTENVATAIETALALRELGYKISDENILNGIKNTTWSGRFQIISKKPLIIIDGAHNKDAAIRLRESIDIYFKNKKINYIIGVLADKDYESIAEITADRAEKIYTVTPESPRALINTELAKIIKKYNKNVTPVSLDKAVNDIFSQNNDNITIIFGSLSYLGSVINIIDNLMP